MRVVFMGTPGFAVPCLRALAQVHDVVAVYTAPDRPTGRGRRITASAVKTAAAELGLELRQPESLRGAEAASTLRADRAEVACVAAYGLIVPPSLLACPAHGFVNVHASLLPRHRGAAPIERAILEGDDETGVSIMRMEAGLDTGPVALQERTAIEGRYADEIRESLALLGAEALLEVLRRVEAGSVVWNPQDTSTATYADKLHATDVALEPSLSVEQAYRRVRASGRHAPSRAAIGGHAVVVQRAEPTTAEAGLGAGSIQLRDGELSLGFADGALRVERLVPAGRKPMSGQDFVRGARLMPDARWGRAG